MKHLKQIILAILLLLLADSIYARSKRDRNPPLAPPKFPVTVHILGMRGSGCPAGEAQAIMSPDSSTLTVLFDSFVTDIPASPVLQTMKKDCLISLGFQFYGPNRIAVVGSDLRGFYLVPSQASTRVSVMHHSIFVNYRNREKLNFSQTYNGPSSGEIFMAPRFTDTVLWSYCGTQLRGQPLRFMNIEISVESQNSNPEENLIAGFDSLDFSANPAFTYHLVGKADSNCPKR